MRLKMLAVLTLSAIQIACAGERVVIVENDCELFPELVELDQEMVDATPRHVIEIVTENYIRLIDWGESMEDRANCL